MVNNGTSGRRHNYKMPPWWVKLPLYLAAYGHDHFYDYRISLQRRYLKKQRDHGLEAAQRLAKREASAYWWAFCKRGVWEISRMLVKWFIGGAS